MAACRFLKRKKAHYNPKYRWVRPFAQVIYHLKTVQQKYPDCNNSAAHVFFKKLFSLSHMDSPR